MESTTYQFFNQNSIPMDAKSAVGPKQYFKTIDALLTFANNKAPNSFAGGMVVSDHNYGVSWQLYNDGTWKARLYDGKFHVKCIFTNDDTVPVNGSTELEGLSTADGITVEEDDIVLVTSMYPNINGIWVVHESTPWVRHSIFDEAIDNLRAITIVIDNGDVYKNSQWRLTTVGAITPATLSSDYSVFISNNVLFKTYTWLNFELVGTGYPSISLTSDSNAYAHQPLILCNATSGDITISRYYYFHLPNLEYKVLKTDNSTNKIIYNNGNSDYDMHVLLEAGDWISVINPENTVTNSDNFIVLSNRINKLLIPTPMTADGKLDIDVPSGYRLWQIRCEITTPGTGDASIRIGTTSLGEEITGVGTPVTINDDGTILTIDIDSNSITEVYVAEGYTGIGYWNGNTITFTLHVIKE